MDSATWRRCIVTQSRRQTSARQCAVAIKRNDSNSEFVVRTAVLPRSGLVQRPLRAMTLPPDQLPAIIEPGALTPMPDTHLVPALIADAGDQASWRDIDFFQHPQPEHPACLCARLRLVLRLVRGPRPDAGGDESPDSPADTARRAFPGRKLWCGSGPIISGTFSCPLQRSRWLGAQSFPDPADLRSLLARSSDTVRYYC